MVASSTIAIVVTSPPAPPGSIALALSPSSLPYGGGNVVATATVTNIPDGTSLFLFYNGANVGGAGVAGGKATWTISVTANATFQVADASSLGAAKATSSVASVAVASAPVGGGGNPLLLGSFKFVSPRSTSLFRVIIVTSNNSAIELSSINGVVNVTAAVDGNHFLVTGTWVNMGLGIVNGVPPGAEGLVTFDYRPGGWNSSSTAYTPPFWGDKGLAVYLVDGSIAPPGYYPSAGWGSFVSWVNSQFPGALLGQQVFDMVNPVVVIKDLGIDQSAANALQFRIHKVEVDYYDYTSGAPLQASANPLTMIGLPSANIGTVSIGSTGVGYVDVSAVGGIGIIATTGPIYSGGTPFTSNTVVSNSLSLT